MSRDAIEKQKARAFRRRRALVNAREVEKLRATPPDLKLRQLGALAESVAALGWDAELAAGESSFRRRTKVPFAPAPAPLPNSR